MLGLMFEAKRDKIDKQIVELMREDQNWLPVFT